MLNDTNIDEQDMGNSCTLLSANSPAERVGAPLYADQWPNKKVARVAYMLGQGCTAQAIAEALADGTTANVITGMASHWGIAIKASRHTYAPLIIEMSGRHRTQLATEARRRGMEMPDLVAKLLTVVATDNLFGAVLD